MLLVTADSQPGTLDGTPTGDLLFVGDVARPSLKVGMQRRAAWR
jgi:hypothetical protein